MAKTLTDLDAVEADRQRIRDTHLRSRDPDGARLELVADPLGQMYGNEVL